MTRRLNAIDLCCGAGGWACAARDLPVRFVAVADLAADCLETWQLNHNAAQPACKLLQVDLSTAEGSEAVIEAVDGEPIDLVLGGIPCEPVSNIRLAGGEKNRACGDELADWHRLMDTVFGLVKRLRPRWWAIEDIVQADRHLPAAIDLGFQVPIRRIHAENYGPQRRKRSFYGVFPRPISEPGPRTLAECLRPGPHLTISHADGYQRQYVGKQLSVGNNLVRVLDPSAPSPTIVGALGRGSRQRRNWMLEAADGRLRRMDWREQAAVQGFPEDYLFVAGIQRAEKMIGQAIDIRAGRAILRAICTASVQVSRPKAHFFTTTGPIKLEI